MIQEVIVTTRNPSGSAQIAPMGIRRQGDMVVIAPFRPSTTLDNLLGRGCAVVNYTDDVRVFAGCLTGRYDWPLVDAERIDAPRLAESLAHAELELADIEDDAQRPRLICRPVRESMHRPFQGFNRAQAAVLELAILVSRLDWLPSDKVEQEIEYLRIAIDKTAGPREQQAWDWLMTRVWDHRQPRGARP
ncbi:MAG: DUF447 domain-containing protein [Chromatiaceae bacterium]